MGLESYEETTMEKVAEIAALREGITHSENIMLLDNDAVDPETYIESPEKEGEKKASFDALADYLEQRKTNSTLSGNDVEPETVMPDGTIFTYNNDGLLENKQYSIRADTSYDMVQRLIDGYEVPGQNTPEIGPVDIMVDIVYDADTSRR